VHNRAFVRDLAVEAMRPMPRLERVMPKRLDDTGVMTMTVNTRQEHLDEIAGLLAQGYVRLRRKRAGMHTSCQYSSDDRDISLDSLCLAEPFIGTEQISRTEDAYGYLA